MVPAESKSNRVIESILAESPVVRIRASKPDPYDGLKGQAYIQARNLAKPVQRVQTSAHTELASTVAGAA